MRAHARTCVCVCVCACVARICQLKGNVADLNPMNEFNLSGRRQPQTLYMTTPRNIMAGLWRAKRDETGRVGGSCTYAVRSSQSRATMFTFRGGRVKGEAKIRWLKRYKKKYIKKQTVSTACPICLLSSSFHGALRPQKTYCLLGTGGKNGIGNESPGPPPCSHSSWALKRCLSALSIFIQKGITLLRI